MIRIWWNLVRDAFGMIPKINLILMNLTLVTDDVII